MISDRYPDRSAPLVLGWIRALDRAQELRQRGMTYRAISIVMADYHGWGFCSDTWRTRLYERGVEKNPGRVAGGLATRRNAMEGVRRGR